MHKYGIVYLSSSIYILVCIFIKKPLEYHSFLYFLLQEILSFYMCFSFTSMGQYERQWKIISFWRNYSRFFFVVVVVFNFMNKNMFMTSFFTNSNIPSFWVKVSYPSSLIILTFQLNVPPSPISASSLILRHVPNQIKLETYNI